MFKTLTAFVVSLFIVGSASAEWINKSVTKHDDWDGTLTVTLSLVKERLKDGGIIALAFWRVRGRNEDAQWAEIAWFGPPLPELKYYFSVREESRGCVPASWSSERFIRSCSRLSREARDAYERIPEGSCTEDPRQFRIKFDGVEYSGSLLRSSPLGEAGFHGDRRYKVNALSERDSRRVLKKVQKHDELKIRMANGCGEYFESSLNIRGKPKVKFDIHIPFFQEVYNGVGLRYGSLLEEAIDD